MENALLTAKEVARILDISPATLHARIRDGLIPKPAQFVTSGAYKVRVWNRADVEAVRIALACRPRSPYGALRRIIREFKQGRARYRAEEGRVNAVLAGFVGDDDLIPADRLASILKVSIQTVYTWTKTANTIRPQFYRNAEGALFFQLADIEHWLERLALGMTEKSAEKTEQPPKKEVVIRESPIRTAETK